MSDQPQPTVGARRVAIFVFVGILAILFFMLTTRASDWFTPTYRLHAYIPETGGIAPGAPVRLSGLEIGRVESVGVNPNRSDRVNNIHVVLNIRSGYQPEIRKDSRLSFVTTSLLGETSASIGRGFEGDPLPNDAQIEFAPSPQFTVGTVLDKLSDCAKVLPEISKQQANETKSTKKSQIP